MREIPQEWNHHLTCSQSPPLMSMQLTGLPIFKLLSYYTAPNCPSLVAQWTMCRCDHFSIMLVLIRQLTDNTPKHLKMYSAVFGKSTEFSFFLFQEPFSLVKKKTFLSQLYFFSSENQTSSFHDPQRSSWLWVTLGRMVWTSSDTFWAAQLLEK